MSRNATMRTRVASSTVNSQPGDINEAVIDDLTSTSTEFSSQPLEALSELITTFPVSTDTPKGIFVGILHSNITQ